MMRVKIADAHAIGGYVFGDFLGLILGDEERLCAIVRLDGYGMLLKSYHPSEVCPTTKEEEEAFKS